MAERDDQRVDDDARTPDAVEQSRRVLATGFAALVAMAVAALLTPPLFLS